MGRKPSASHRALITGVIAGLIVLGGAASAHAAASFVVAPFEITALTVPDPIVRGADTPVSVTVRNTGDVASEIGDMVTISAPGDASLAGVDAQCGNRTADTHSVNCILPAIQPGSEVTVSVTLAAGGASDATTATLTASIIRMGNPEPVDGDPVTTVTVDIETPPAADLRLEEFTVPATIERNVATPISVKIRNDGGAEGGVGEFVSITAAPGVVVFGADALCGIVATDPTTLNCLVQSVAIDGEFTFSGTMLVGDGFTGTELLLTATHLREDGTATEPVLTATATIPPLPPVPTPTATKGPQLAESGSELPLVFLGMGAVALVGGMLLRRRVS